MPDANAEIYPGIRVCHIHSLSSHCAHFMSARSRERRFLPRQGARWWQIEFPSVITQERFIMDLYRHGFVDEVEAKGLNLEIQACTDDTARLIQSLVGDGQETLTIDALESEVMTIQNDTHALLCNSRNNGALVFAGKSVCHLQFTASPTSAWLVLEALSQRLATHDIIHFDPAGHLMVFGDETRRLELTRELLEFVRT